MTVPADTFAAAEALDRGRFERARADGIELDLFELACRQRHGGNEYPAHTYRAVGGSVWCSIDVEGELFAYMLVHTDPHHIAEMRIQLCPHCTHRIGHGPDCACCDRYADKHGAELRYGEVSP